MDFDKLEEELIYTDEVLLYLKNKLDEGALHCFKLVADANDTPYGLLRTKLPDFKGNRRKYDLGFTILEAQGFVHSRPIGNMRPYFLSVRGKQLKVLLGY